LPHPFFQSSPAGTLWHAPPDPLQTWQGLVHDPTKGQQYPPWQTLLVQALSPLQLLPFGYFERQELPDGPVAQYAKLEHTVSSVQVAAQSLVVPPHSETP
jgi:hypothetical protein